MGNGFKHGGSGGGSELNFRVISGTAAPAAPRENDIWVNTESMTGWCFSAQEPEAAEGLVWVTVGSSTGVAFNALKKNALMVYPISAKQYADGAWTNKAAQIFQSGVWSSFSTTALYLYQPGDDGGFVAEGMAAGSLSGYTSVPTVTYGSESLVILPGKSTAVTAYRGGIVRTENKFDLSGYNTLTFEGTAEGIGVGNSKLSIWSEMGAVQTDNRVKYADLANGSDPVVIDVSDLDGNHYIGLGFDSVNVQIMVTMTSLRLE